MVARSTTRDLGRELVEQIRVGSRIDLASQQARSAFDGKLAHFAPQGLARTRGLETHFLARTGYQPLRLGRGGALGFLDHLVRALARLIDDLRRALARRADDLFRSRLGLVQVLLALRGRRQTLGDHLLSSLDFHEKEWPYVLHHQPGDEEKYEPLNDKRNGYVHTLLPALGVPQGRTMRRLRLLPAQKAEERVRVEQQEAHGHADDGHRVQKACDDEHLGLQHGGQFRLPRGALQEFAAQEAEADGGTGASEADHEAGCDHGGAQELSELGRMFHYLLSVGLGCLEKRRTNASRRR